MPSVSESSRLSAFVRNRYFYGQLLDVEHFDCEQRYFMEKMAQLSRLVCGFGVVCGLDVRPCDEGRGVCVTAGAAIDPCGRWIVVPCETTCYRLPDADQDEEKRRKRKEREEQRRQYGRPGGEVDPDDYVHLVICYHECAAEPTPVMAPDCGSPESCAPGKTEERYRIELRPGMARRPGWDDVPDLCPNGRVDYDALARRVTRPCAKPADTCITLANVELPDPEDHCDSDDIDITVRPVCFTNDLLLELIVGMSQEPHGQGRGGKY